MMCWCWNHIPRECLCRQWQKPVPCTVRASPAGSGRSKSLVLCVHLLQVHPSLLYCACTFCRQWQEHVSCTVRAPHAGSERSMSPVLCVHLLQAVAGANPLYCACTSCRWWTVFVVSPAVVRSAWYREDPPGSGPRCWPQVSSVQRYALATALLLDGRYREVSSAVTGTFNHMLFRKYRKNFDNKSAVQDCRKWIIIERSFAYCSNEI